MPDVLDRPDPFELALPLESRPARAALVAARPFLSRVLGFRALQRLYPESSTAPGATFEARALHTLEVSLDAVPSAAAIPETGPLIVAANHPTGALDGLVVSELVRRVRPDVRVLANRLLARIPELRESCFFVDPFGGPDAAARSRAGLRAAHLWLREGGALVMFPSGEVAGNGEREWHDALGRLALATRARVLPVLLEGRNSSLFYAAGRVHPLLRTALLGRELLNKRGTKVRMNVFVNDVPSPTLEVDRLEGDATSGGLRLQGPATFANLVITPDAVDDLSPEPVSDPMDGDRGLVRHWRLSPSAALAMGKDAVYDEMPRGSTEWKTITAERHGLVNISREYGRPLSEPNRALAWLKTTITSDRKQTKKVDIGWTRELWVFVNGKLVYADKNLFEVEGARKFPDARCSLENGSVMLPLEAGDNEIAVALANNFFGWGLMLRVTDPEGVQLAAK